MFHSVSTLPNGLRVVSVPLPHLHSVEIAIYIKVGARNDPWQRSGLSHFLEHMLFRGTAEYANSLELETAFEELGGVVNAATDTDTTCFYATMYPPNAGKGLHILASMLLRPKLEGIELERRIICEEALEDINQEGVVTNPDLVMGRLLWPDHPLAGATVGSQEDIARISEEDLHKHIYNWYTPSNAVLVIAGPHDTAEMLGEASRAFGSWPSRSFPETVPFFPSPLLGPNSVFVQDSDSQLTVQLAFHAFRRDDPQLTSLKVLRRVLAGGGCSRLHLALREQLGLVYSVESAIGAYDETGCLTIDLATAPENIELVLKTTIAELVKISSETVPERELNRVKIAYTADLDFSRDSVTEMGTRYGWGTLMDSVRGIDEDQRLVASVTPEELRQTASLIFKPENRHMVIVGPIDFIDTKSVLALLTG